MKNIHIYKIIKFSFGIPLILSLIFILLIIFKQPPYSSILAEFFFITITILLALLFGLITPNDFYKNFDGEIIDEYESLNWRFSNSFWLVIFIIQVILSAFPIITITFIHNLSDNYASKGYDGIQKNAFGYYMFFSKLPIILFIFRSFILRPIKNEKEILKIKRRQRLRNYISLNKLDLIDYSKWIKEDSEIQEDKGLMLDLIKRDGFAFILLNDTLKKDKEIVIEAMKEAIVFLKEADVSLQNDREFIIELVKSNGYVLRVVSEHFRKDKEIVLVAVKNDGDALQYADESLQNDPEILNAIKNQYN